LRLRLWAAHTWHDLHAWPGKPHGVTFYEGFVSPRLTVLHWRLTRRCVSCGVKRPGHKMGCAYR
jgi:hypothetical protein